MSIMDAVNRNDLLAAISAGDSYAVNLMLRQGADLQLNKQDQKGRTVLHEAVYWATQLVPATVRLQIVQMLLDAGADLNIRASGDCSVLMEAARHSRDTDMVRMLLARGAVAWPKDAEKLKHLGQPEILALIRTAAKEAFERTGQLSSAGRHHTTSKRRSGKLSGKAKG